MTDKANSSDQDGPRHPPPKGSTVDELIRWIETQRERYRDRKLVELIDPHSISPDSLVELAAIDLISQRRHGSNARVEDYLNQFPQLSGSDQSVLDLIDAEICVRREAKDDRSIEFYTDRFPELAEPIRQLIHLDLQPGAAPLPSGTASAADSQPTSRGSSVHAASESATIEIGGTAEVGSKRFDESDHFELQRHLTVAEFRSHQSRPATEQRNEDSIETPIPVQLPDWLSRPRCLATTLLQSGRCWLLKGLDRERGDSVAVKIIPLPSHLERTERTRILDLCEASSNVTHPCWVAPRIAAIRNNYLAIVRPWVFGNSYRVPGPDDLVTRPIPALIKFANALSAAHRSGATHGSVQENNLIIDHHGEVNIVDAASSGRGWEYYLGNWDNQLSNTLDARIRRDTGGLLALIAQALTSRASVAQTHSDSEERPVGDCLAQIGESIGPYDSDTCARIGESLLSIIDQPPKRRSWWHG